MKSKQPKIIEIDLDQLDALLRRIEEKLDRRDYQLIRSVLQSYAFLVDLVGDKHTTIRRLRQLLFGASTEKSSTVQGEASKTGAEDTASSGDPSEDPPKPAPRRGHGRNGAEAYPGAKQVSVAHESLQPGDPCPACPTGTLYASRPGVLVRIVGQAPLQATVFQLQKLRCHLCGQVFTAAAPPETPPQKYDATAAAMIGLLKYGAGMPFNRLAGLQGNTGVPLPASTQWRVISTYAAAIAPAFEELIRQAAQGEVLHNDDTTVKILELMGERTSLSDETGETDSERTGMFTSGIVSLCDGHRVALFFSGRQHAGENLAEVLKHRAQQLERPIQMCDALSRNLPGELKTIVANCLAHARRKFVEVYDRFPDECDVVLEALKVIYHHDAQAREKEMSPQERLEFHQLHSQPTMEGLKSWLDRQWDEKLVEPNSTLGEVISYLRTHWDKLTLFLRKAGAPLDNNICERALKKAILHRKNAYFYKTRKGAEVGDRYMSLIHTCELCGANALDYLTALHRHSSEVAAHPSQWMPWNYQSALSKLAAPAALSSPAA